MKSEKLGKTVTVDLNEDTPYLEPDSRFYRFKRRLMYSNIISIIDKHIGKSNSAKILEVGTGSGYLLSFLEQEFPNSSFSGLEYDPRLVELSNSKLTRSTVFPGDAEQFHNLGNFNLVVSSQVIEHLYNPINFVSSVQSVLIRDGILVLTTPNLDCLAKRMLGEKWHGYRHDHVSLKSRKEWDKFMTENGFEIIYSGTTFFSGIPVMNKFPLGIINWMLLYFFGSIRWNLGESYVGVFKVRRDPFF